MRSRPDFDVTAPEWQSGRSGETIRVTANLANLIIWPGKSTGHANQEFQLNPAVGGYRELANQNSSKSLAVLNASVSANAAVIQYTTNGAPNSLWWPISLGGGQWQFINMNSGLCMDVSGASTSKGTHVHQWFCKSPAAGTIRHQVAGAGTSG